MNMFSKAGAICPRLLRWLKKQKWQNDDQNTMEKLKTIIGTWKIHQKLQKLINNQSIIQSKLRIFFSKIKYLFHNHESSFASAVE